MGLGRLGDTVHAAAIAPRVMAIPPQLQSLPPRLEQ